MLLLKLKKNIFKFSANNTKNYANASYPYKAYIEKENVQAKKEGAKIGKEG